MGKNLEGFGHGIIVNTIPDVEWRGRENLEKFVRLAYLRTEYEAVVPTGLQCQMTVCKVKTESYPLLIIYPIFLRLHYDPFILDTDTHHHKG
jgi:hypothetical protein